MISSQCSRFYRAVFASSGAVLGLLPLLIAGEARAGWLFYSVADTRNLFSATNTQYTNIDTGLGTYGGTEERRPIRWDILGLEGDTALYHLAEDPMYNLGQGMAMADGKVAFFAQRSGTNSDAIFVRNPYTPKVGEHKRTLNGATPDYDPNTATVDVPDGPAQPTMPVVKVGDPTADGAKIVSFGQGIAMRSIPGSNAKEVAFVATVEKDGQVTTNIYIDGGSGPSFKPKLVAKGEDYGDFAPGLSMVTDNNGKPAVAFTATKGNVTEVYKANGSVDSSNLSSSFTVTSLTECASANYVCGVKKEAPSINKSGKVSFTTTDGVFVHDPENGAYPIISTLPSLVSGSFREANINNNDLVSAFTAVKPIATAITAVPTEVHNHLAQGQVIFTENGQGTSSVIAGNYYNYDPAPGEEVVSTWDTFGIIGTSSINDENNVAFMARGTPYYVKGIFNGPSFSNNAIIRSVVGGFEAIDNVGIYPGGDTLFDGTAFQSDVVDLSMDRNSLGKDNELTFWAKLANGIEGIFMAVPDAVGVSQFNPWLPNCEFQAADSMSFCGVTSGHWFDPPTTTGFDYEMNGDSLFTSILDLPANFENPFTVLVNDIALGIFGNGDSLNFGDYSDLLGDLLVDSNGTKGVKKFTVRTNDLLDPTNPMALPIKLAFNTDTADFTMRALDVVNPPEEPSEVPEPATLLGLLTIGTFFLGCKRR